MTEDRSVRLHPFNAVFITAAAWAGAAGLLVTALLLLSGLDGPLFWPAVGLVAIFAFAYAAYRVRLEVDGQEIRVFNVRRTYRIPWHAVSRIDVVAWWLSPSVLIVGNAAVRLTTLSGERVVIDASTREASRVLDALSRFSAGRVEIKPG